jgi:glycerol-3-phosphate dehydrogenase (NAD(P)+)
MGDLIVTCTSMHSRNRRAGILVGMGCTAQEAMEQVGAVVEGYYATKSAFELAEKMGVDMPISKAAFKVLYGGETVRKVIDDLMARHKRGEMDISWIK